MTTEAAIANTTMEGSGFYNRNSDLQAAGIELALPLFEEAARTIPIDGGAHTPIVIADYGSSQGRNSMRPSVRPGASRPLSGCGPTWRGGAFSPTAVNFATAWRGGSPTRIWLRCDKPTAS